MSEIKKGYTRISDILSRLRDRAHINPMILQDKANIGTEVHDNIHMHEMGIPVNFDLFAIRNPMTGYVNREEYRGQGYFESYKLWRKDKNIVYRIMEERFYDDELMITGQVDAVAIMNDLTWLIDFKCSYQADLEIWNMQAHFYWYLLKKNSINLEKMMFMQLEKSGKNPVIFEFIFDEKTLSQCIDEAILYQEEKNLALMLD